MDFAEAVYSRVAHYPPDTLYARARHVRSGCGEISALGKVFQVHAVRAGGFVETLANQIDADESRL